MTNKSDNTASLSAQAAPQVTAIVPARNEEAAIASCIEALTHQPEIAEILVVDDQSVDRTAETVRALVPKISHLRLLETQGVPTGWVGKNNAAALGARTAKSPWLLFTDADVEQQPGAVSHALQIAEKTGAALVSFSPEQVTEKWYERALTPFVYCRLAKHFSFESVNDPSSGSAAANGQFLLIRRDAYESIGGHASVAGEVLEDVALARRAKAQGYRLWFGSGQGFVRARMYRSFGAMWKGWKKNLYLLIGGTPRAVYRELESVVPWIPALLLLLGIKIPFTTFLAVILLLLRQHSYGLELTRNQYPLKFILYYVPAVILYTGVLWASYRSHRKGKVEWKGRVIAVTLPEAPK